MKTQLQKLQRAILKSTIEALTSTKIADLIVEERKPYSAMITFSFLDEDSRKYFIATDSHTGTMWADGDDKFNWQNTIPYAKWTKKCAHVYNTMVTCKKQLLSI